MVLCCRGLVCIALLATIVSTLRVYPHQLAYFNEFSGGPDNGHRHLLDSNIEWGQDLLYLKEWQARHSSHKDLCLDCDGLYDARDLGIAACRRLGTALGSEHDTRAERSELVAISTNRMHRPREQGGEERVSVASARMATPVFVCGSTILVFRARDLHRP